MKKEIIKAKDLFMKCPREYQDQFRNRIKRVGINDKNNDKMHIVIKDDDLLAWESGFAEWLMTNHPDYQNIKDGFRIELGKLSELITPKN